MRTDISWIGTQTPGRFGVMPRPRGGDWLADEVEAMKRAGVGVLVCLLTAAEAEELDLADEARVCAECGIAFESVPVADREVPHDEGRFLAAVRSVAGRLAAGAGVAVHCRQGVGPSRDVRGLCAHGFGGVAGRLAGAGRAGAGPPGPGYRGTTGLGDGGGDATRSAGLSRGSDSSRTAWSGGVGPGLGMVFASGSES